MKIGFLGFGKVSKTLMKLINSPDITFLTATENRSEVTIENIKNEDIVILNSFKAVALNSDILISANSPSQALNVAIKYGVFFKGIYLDLNNISPETTIEISKKVDNFVDGAIIGKIDSKKPIIYLAGKNLDKLAFLEDFLEIYKISENPGDVARLKLLRSCYTKSISAVLMESAEIAKNLNLENEFFDILALTEGEDFKEKSISRIINTKNNKKRKSEELKEIIDYFENQELTMVKAALQKFNQ